MSRCIAALVAVFLACSCALPAVAATAGLVRGTVTLEGKPQPGVALTLTGEGSRFTATSDAHGDYVFSQVPFGRYHLSAKTGSIPSAEIDLTVTSNGVVTIDVALTKLKTIAVTTAAARNGVNGYPPSVHQIDRAQIQTSPVQNSLDKMIETLPGVVPFSYNEPVINGFHGVTYNLDGAPLPLATTSNFAEIVDPKNIDSLEVYTGAIPAEYGGDRMGGVVNIITNRPSDVPQGFFGTVTAGFGNQAQGVGSLDTAARTGSTEIFFNSNTESTSRGLDAPTFDPIHDNSSESDQFFRIITQMSPRSSLAFDFSNQLAQFQIPINTDPNNEFDPIFTPAGTDDVQREYDRFAHLNFTQTSKDGNGIFQVIPWTRSTRVDYDGDLFNDVLGITPDFSSDVVCADCGTPDASSGGVHNVGLNSSTFANYVGLRMSDFRATKSHSWKIGLDVNRENVVATQTFACYFAGCADSGPPPHTQPYYLISTPQQAQAGSQIGIYGQDTWHVASNVEVNYGLRYDHSTGYTSGNMISPRIGINVAADPKNTLHVFYGRFYAAPLLEDVRQDCVLLQTDGGCTTTPVYDLKPEQDAYFEGGILHTFNPNFTGSLDIFRKTTVNILDTTQLLNTPLFAVFNNAIGVDNGAELRLQDRLLNDDSWFFTLTYSQSLAAGISGSTFLFGTQPNPPGVSFESQLSPEDHDETVASSAAYTWRFGTGHAWFSTLQANYGSGFPVAFENANVDLSGRLPAHTTFDIAAGRYLTPGHVKDDHGLGVSFIVTNVLNHQYVLKVANGFNTTQIANGRNILLRLSAPF
jgi:outer membrane receptor protein involved in Fe transport